MIDIESIIERIKRVHGCQSDKEVASLLKLSPTDFSNRKRRETLLPLIIDWAVKEDVDIEMLVKGRGDRIDVQTHKTYCHGGESWNVYALNRDKGAKNWMSEHPVNSLTLSDFADERAIVKMSGSSMEPTIHDGAIMGVDYSVQKSLFISGDIYVMWLPNEGPVVRRVFVDMEKILLKADNSTFPDVILGVDEIPDEDFILGKVDWVLQVV